MNMQRWTTPEGQGPDEAGGASRLDRSIDTSIDTVPRRLCRFAALALAGSLGFFFATASAQALVHGLGADITFELDLDTGDRGDAPAYESVIAVCLLFALAFTAKFARWFRTLPLVQRHPVDARVVVWASAIALTLVMTTVVERINERVVRQDAIEGLMSAALDSTRAACVVDGLADSFQLYDDDDDDIEMTPEDIDTMLAIGLTCQLDGAAPCVIEGLADLANRDAFVGPIDVLLPFDRGALTRQDIEKAQAGC